MAGYDARQIHGLTDLDTHLKMLPSSLRASEAGRHHTARAENERADLVGVPNLSSSQTFDGNEHHLLREIVGGHVIVKMPHAEQTDPPRKPAIQLTFGRGRVASRRRRHFTSEVAVGPIHEGRSVGTSHAGDGTSRPHDGQPIAAAGDSQPIASGAPSNRSSTSAAARSAWPPSPTNADPCMAASTCGSSAASFSM